MDETSGHMPPAGDNKASLDMLRREVMDASMTKLVLIYFWTARSPACAAMNPIIDTVSAQYTARGVKLVKIDIDKNPAIAAQFRIQSAPTTYAIFQGRPVADLSPARDQAGLIAYLDQILEQLPIGDPETKAREAQAKQVEGALAQADAALSAGDAATAAQIYGALHETFPDHVGAMAGLVRALIALKRLDEARAVMDKIGADAKDPAVAQARAALDLAQPPAQGTGEIDDLNARIAANPDDLEARFARAQLLSAQGQRDESGEDLLTIITQNRDWNDGAARQYLLKLLEAAGFEDPWAIAVRRRLSTLLFA